MSYGGVPPLAFAAALGHGDFESGNGGLCPLTFAAALGHGDFESGSDSKSNLLQSDTLYSIFRTLRRRGGGLRSMFL